MKLWGFVRELICEKIHAKDLQSIPLQKKHIRLPFEKNNYAAIVAGCTLFRSHLDVFVLQHPELFPTDINQGYRMKDCYRSVKTDHISLLPMLTFLRTLKTLDTFF